MTSPAQTAVDLASEANFTAGVTAVDQALWKRRPGGALAEREDLIRALDTNRRRGLARVPAVIDFGTGLADSVRESEARVLLDRLGFPRPSLQKKDRADALRRQVSALSRWRTPDHRDPARLYRILVADGLPSRFPPPRKRL